MELQEASLERRALYISISVQQQFFTDPAAASFIERALLSEWRWATQWPIGEMVASWVAKRGRCSSMVDVTKVVKKMTTEEGAREEDEVGDGTFAEEEQVGRPFTTSALCEAASSDFSGLLRRLHTTSISSPMRMTSTLMKTPLMPGSSFQPPAYS